MDIATVFIIARAIVCTIGIFINLILLSASFHLRRPLNLCSRMIAADALTVLLYCSSGLVALGTFLLHQNQIQLVQCVPLQVIPLAGFFMNRATTFGISFDRLFCVMFPIWYKHGKRFFYAFILISVGLLYTSVNLIPIILEDYKQPNVPVWCAMTDLFQSLNAIISQSIIGISVTSMIFYAIIGIRIRQSRKQRLDQNRGPNYTERMFNSLLAIMTSILFGSILVSAVKSLLTVTTFSSEMQYILTSGASLVSVANSGSHPLYLYALSKEYRLAMNKVLRAILCRNSQTVPVTVISTVGIGNKRPSNNLTTVE